MEPLRAIPDPTLRRLRGVAFDVDDTVTRDGILEEPAFAALWRLREAGLRLVAVTGRPLGWTDVLARQWPVDLAVGENGAGWAWRDASTGAFRTGYFQRDPAVRAADRERLGRLREEVTRQLPGVSVADDQDARRCDLAFDVGEHHRSPPAERDALVDLIRSRGFRATVSSVHAHAMPGDWDKARGIVAAILGVLGVDLGDPGNVAGWAYVGDSPNDAAAFDHFPLSIGVANVRDHDPARLGTPPRFVTSADRGRGFAELAATILAARGSAR